MENLRKSGNFSLQFGGQGKSRKNLEHILQRLPLLTIFVMFDTKTIYGCSFIFLRLLKLLFVVWYLLITKSWIFRQFLRLEMCMNPEDI